MPGFPGAPVLSPREPFSPLGPGRPAGPGTPIILGPRGRCRERGTELSRGEALMPSSLVGGMPEKKKQEGELIWVEGQTRPSFLPTSRLPKYGLTRRSIIPRKWDTPQSRAHGQLLPDFWKSWSSPPCPQRSPLPGVPWVPLVPGSPFSPCKPRTPG